MSSSKAYPATVISGKGERLQLQRCRLRVVQGPDKGLVCDFGKRVIRIGAHDTADLQLADPKVSGSHCEIVLDETGCMLQDLESTNGTHVAGCRVVTVYLGDGSVFELGDTRLRFERLRDSVDVPLWADTSFHGLVGQSPVMRALFAQIAAIAASDITVLTTGETGTGKELVAQAVHEASHRGEGPFVVFDCGAIPPNLMESQIFGHERGAFTGAVSTQVGVFEQANGGTLFLDELGELPLGLQPKLLRVLETRRVQRIGAARPMTTDVRVVAATNRQLLRDVNRGTFRADLYYRIAVAQIHLPPLRDRKEDIPLLVDQFLSEGTGENLQIQPKTLEMMARHDWPGNVRELRNMVERAVLLREEPSSTTAIRRGGHVWGSTTGVRTSPGKVQASVDLEVPFKVAKGKLIEDFEQTYLVAMLEKHDYNVSAAARAAGLDRMTVHKMIQRLGIKRPEPDILKD